LHSKRTRSASVSWRVPGAGTCLENAPRIVRNFRSPSLSEAARARMSSAVNKTRDEDAGAALARGDDRPLVGGAAPTTRRAALGRWSSATLRTRLMLELQMLPD